MYTYESFVTDGAFTLLRPVISSFLLITVVLFILVWLPKVMQGFLNGFTVMAITMISIIVSGQVLFFEAILADELGLGGGSGFWMFLVIVILGIVSPIIYFIRHREAGS
ncbi:hypothetical protein DFO70_101479 [Cytobacillus firmus]|uniref:Uncharacterized protein n=2 Tax=Cytobacillus TaxID=2675230 RepID=A0A366K6A3_CYTFI|nr:MULTISPECIES: hypothetical protein [Cytobacillus]RBP96663.1 hypothetical protein DFO70_101479 [Cytobacillus firmus]TDX45610.1 hypothetical protein DFO72_10278 [Cytobacillus oceanisediminis]